MRGHFKNPEHDSFRKHTVSSYKAPCGSTRPSTCHIYHDIWCHRGTCGEWGERTRIWHMCTAWRYRTELAATMPMPGLAPAHSGNGGQVPSSRKPGEGWYVSDHCSTCTQPWSPLPADPTPGTFRRSGETSVSGDRRRSLPCSWWRRPQGQRLTRKIRVGLPSEPGTCSRRRRRRESSRGSPSRCRTQRGPAWCQWSACSRIPTRRTWWSRPSEVLQTPRHHRQNRAARNSTNKISTNAAAATAFATTTNGDAISFIFVEK